MDEELVTIRSYSFPWEANVEQAVLEEEGIPTYLQDAETVSTQWLYSNAIGGVKLQVPESRVEEAREILSGVGEEGGAALGEWDIEGPACPNCGSTDTEREHIEEAAESFRCLDCDETWEAENE